MGVVTYDYESTSPVAPSRLFKAFTVEAPKSIEVEANPSSGSIVKINFVEGLPFQYMKHQIGGHDENNFSYSYDLIEGGPWGDKLEKISYENKFEAAAGGGSICKNEIKALIKGSEGVYKPVEAYLLANPESCN
ncbi:hypothetical protein ES288_D10G212700v1 [Gossypium darwinii]|uniref:Bet v I/Major latex protein domain-containing protein n=1 Tax=Gossypium darwinii TaxID=34276 RepID=A0A5D2B312_GOSDA|nr:hypothetical protein ES288_D10G212700v1 [Gossypium darwinii]